MEWDFQQLFSFPPITGVTINTVTLSPDFRTLIYIVVAVVVVIAAMLALINGSRPSLAIRKAAIAAFFCGGMLYAIQADYGWYSWLSADAKTFSGLGTEEKLGHMEGGLYDFTRAAKNVVKGDYALFSSDTYLPLRAEYFLLPLRKRSEADYIIVLADQDARYDQATRIFTRGDIRIRSVDPVLVFAQNAYVLKRSPL